jgi:hypothetical protein
VLGGVSLTPPTKLLDGGNKVPSHKTMGIGAET